MGRGGPSLGPPRGPRPTRDEPGLMAADWVGSPDGWGAVGDTAGYLEKSLNNYWAKYAIFVT